MEVRADAIIMRNDLSKNIPESPTLDQLVAKYGSAIIDRMDAEIKRLCAMVDQLEAENGALRERVRVLEAENNELRKANAGRAGRGW
jgi:outer membrane murein-binding lipoprotein Lpp